MSTRNDRYSSRRKSLGLSLVELVMFIVIVGAAVAGIIGVINVTTRGSVDPMIHKQALAIAEAMMEEVRLQPFTYCDPDDPSAATAELSGAPIAFRAAASAAANSGVLTLTISNPTGTVANDVMVASIGFRPATATVTPPSGWTLVRSVQNTTGSGPPAVNVYRKVAGASEPASYDWTFSSSTGTAGGIQTFSGVDTTTPVDVENGAPTAATYDQATPSITTTVANTMLVTSHFIGNRDLWADPPTWGGTQGFQARAASSPAMAQGSWALQAAIGATGAKTATDLGPDAADTGAAHILALKPGGGCPVLAEAMGPEPGETRYSSTLPFDNVNDYHGFDSNTATPSGIRSIDGSLIAGLDGYRVTVSVAGQTLGGIGDDVAGNPQSLLITVTVTGPGETTVTLHGFRTRYAPNALP
jgi:Tfp pilus assembly protein PilV